jgi:hypothetical protein
MLEIDVQTNALESAILQELGQVDTCTFQELSERLPAYSWNHVYSEVNRLNRAGTVTLKHPAPFLLILSLPRHGSADSRPMLCGNVENKKAA